MAEQVETVNGDEVDEWFDDEDLEPDEQPVSTPVEDAAKKYAVSQLRVVRETKDYQLDYLQHALQPGRELIDISPAYQRRLRWPSKKKSLLIESFLLNIPVPPIFLFERDYNSYEVIDGRQRLDAISSFLSNDFPLTGLQYWQELNSRRFLDLPEVLKKGLLRRSLPAVVLLAETRAPESDGLDVRRVLFDRLNTGGIRLNPQELRNALYPGRLNALLISLARSPLFTSVWNIPPYRSGEEKEPSDDLLKNALFASMADAELVLRFFALRDAVANEKKGSLRLLLDQYMEQNADASESEIAALSQDFHNCLTVLKGLFGNATFRLPGNGRLSRPLYDALMIAFDIYEMPDLLEREDAIKSALSTALSNGRNYDILVGRGNTIRAVHDRVDLAADILLAGA